MNNVTLIGRITADPELKQTTNGNSALSYSVAVDRSYKNKEGSRDTDFFNCEAFGKTAEFITKYYHKGDPIAINGELRTQKWEKDGVKRERVVVHVSGVEFLPSSKGNSGAAAAGNEAPAASAAGQEEFVDVSDNDDLPF